MKQASILIVDRHQDVIELAITVLKEQGWDNIHTSNKADEAIEILKNKPINLVVCGSRLLSARGVEFLVEAQVLALAPIIFHTVGLSDLVHFPQCLKLSKEFFETTNRYLRVLQDRNVFRVPQEE